MDEVRIKEHREVIDTENENYKCVKPAEGMTVGEARFFWDRHFLDKKIESDETDKKLYDGMKEDIVPCQHTEIRDGDTYYYDDNGELYRVGKELAPNCEYELNGYKYRTDHKARIVSAEGVLHVKKREGRLQINDSIEDIGKGDQEKNDDRGHLIGDQFDGPNGLENMVPQDADINRKEYRNFENELADMVKKGKEVHVDIKPIYDSDSRRPVAISVSYSVDGKESVRVFPNGKKE